MTLLEFSVKVKLRLNKSDSDDYDNLWKYVLKEATNKAVNDWFRRQYRGKNLTQEGDEETLARIDDLQVLLMKDNLTVRDKGIYTQTGKLPSDYRYFKRLTPYVSKGSCTNVRIQSHLKEEANVDVLLPQLPSFKFEETFHTIIGNRINVYHNKDFSVDKVELTYYRNPKVYDFKNLDTVMEFNDNVCEILAEEAAKIIASDIESLNQVALKEKSIEDKN